MLWLYRNSLDANLKIVGVVYEALVTCEVSLKVQKGMKFSARRERWGIMKMMNDVEVHGLEEKQ